MIETQSGGGMRKQPIAVERKKKTHQEYSPLFHYQLPVQTAGDCDEWENPALSGSLLILVLPFLITVTVSSAGSEAA